MGQTVNRLFVLLLFLSLAAAWDLSLHRVPNGLILTGWLVGLGFSPGISYLGQSALPVLALFPLWKRRMIGGGDVKLLAMLCGWLGIQAGFLCFFYSLFFAGGIGICRLLLHRSVWIRISYFFHYWKSGAARRALPYEGPERAKAELPFAAALLAGTLAHLAFR